jgi:hypothetical protein
MAFYESYLSTGTGTRAVSDPRESSSAPERRGGNRGDLPSKTSEVIRVKFTSKRFFYKNVNNLRKS